MKTVLKTLGILVGIGIIFFGLIQLVPVQTENPPVVSTVSWDSPQTEALFARACADCHSNETIWPWYSRVAPMSWLVARDVNEGREKFNISDLGGMQARARAELPEEIGEVVREGEMPMAIYLPLHPGANLSAVEMQSLITGLQKTLAGQ